MKNPRMNTSEVAEILISELAKLEHCTEEVKKAVNRAEQIRFPIDTFKLEQIAKQMNDNLISCCYANIHIRRDVFKWVLCVVLGLIAALSISSTVFYSRWKEAVGVEQPGESQTEIPLPTPPPQR